MFKLPRIFLFYWALILPLGAYLVYDYCTDYSAELEPVLKNTVMFGAASAYQFNHLAFRSTYVYDDVYHYSESYKTVRNAISATKYVVDSCQNIVRERLSEDEAYTPADLNKIAVALRYLGDSLLTIVSRDSIIEAKLQPLLYQPAAALQTPEMAAFFKNASRTQTDLYLNDLVWKMELAAGPVLDYLKKLITRKESVSEYFPAFTTEDCPRSGKPFTADISIVPYIADSENLKIWINGKAYPVHAGIAKFQMSYPKPGAYTIRVAIEETIPYSKEPARYSGEFSINVLKP